MPGRPDGGQEPIQIQPDVLRPLHDAQHVGGAQLVAGAFGQPVLGRVGLDLVQGHRAVDQWLYRDQQPVIGGRDTQIYGLVGVLQAFGRLGYLLGR